MYRVNQYPPPPPPPRGSSAVLIVGIILGCVGLAALAAAFVALRGHPSTAAAMPSAMGSASASSGSLAPVVADPVVVDEPIGAPGSPASSLKARPPWGKLEALSPYAAETKQYAPQLEVPLDVYLASSPMSGDVDRGFVICRFQTFGHADSFSGDDLHARATFGGTPEVANDGPEDANLAFVSAPLVTLKKNDTVRLDVYDRDVTEIESITHATHKYDGTELSITDTGANMECRTLSADALKRVTSEHASVADTAITALKKKKLDVSESVSWGWPWFDLLGAARKVGDVAALVGWDDARAKSRVASYDAVTASLEAERKRLFDDLHAKSTDDGDASGLHVHFVELLCGAKKLAAPGGIPASDGACVARLTIRNDTTAPLQLSNLFPIASHLATEKGPSAAKLYDSTGVSPNDLDVAGKASVDVYLAAGRDQKMDGPTLANVCVGHECAWVKVK